MASTDRSFLARVFSPGPARENHPASRPTGKAGRNLPQAITTAVVLIAAVAVPLFTSLPAFVGVIAFVCLVCTSRCSCAPRGVCSITGRNRG